MYKRQGILTDAKTVVADEVLAKHDENYLPPELAESLKGIKHVKPDVVNEINGR